MPGKEVFKLSDFFNESQSLNLSSNSQTRNMYIKDNTNPCDKLSKLNVYEVLGETSFGNPKYISKDVIGTPIQEFFRGANVFITGGTGFVGKILTEKLVRSVPHLGHIYLLIRAKRGKRAQQRFEQLLEDPVFRRMREEVPDYASKLSVVEGDISAPRLGLSAADERTLLDHVTVVFHSAADVRFIEPLRVAISSNFTGSRNVLTLARGMSKLKSYVHVSTAYSQCVRRVVPETVTKMSVHYKEVLSLVDSLTDKDIEKDLPSILHGWPNTYTFTKAMCEDMVLEEGRGLPICIFRPSSVISTYKEPVRGWTDNMYGPMGLAMAASMGVLHSFPQDYELWIDVVPVDYTVNCIISTAWDSFTNKPKDEVSVYNYVSTPSSTISWRVNERYGRLMKNTFPFLQAIWCYSFVMTNILLVDQIIHFLFHKIPGIVLDKIAVWSGGKARLTKIYDRVHALKRHLKFFTSRIWEFESENVQKMLCDMTPEDKTLFNFDIRELDRFEHLLVSKLGVRYYFLKEKMETLPQAQRKNTVFSWLHSTGKCVFGLILLKIMATVAHVLPI